MNQNNFSKQRQEAILQMQEMQSRSRQSAPCETPPAPQPPLGLPLLDKLKTDGDMTLIIGILLLLLSEKADKRLLFALVYILL